MNVILFSFTIAYFTTALLGWFLWGMFYPGHNYWNNDKRQEHSEQWPIWTLLWPFGFIILIVKFVGLSIRVLKNHRKK